MLSDDKSGLVNYTLCDPQGIDHLIIIIMKISITYFLMESLMI